ncbi:hypothetical protein [uncultured Parabacteroides sp.]|uniref:hypothetical protein n=1 Tax=uncultured Parabacteroides sp. TaxID=512312 RepID=UPI002658DF91|nr:hypothetical protein [uncultured Parabacteroides sp.]
MPELNTYLLLLLVSFAVIFACGIHLLLKSISRTENVESDRSNFHHQFKGITGMSPEDYPQVPLD